MDRRTLTRLEELEGQSPSGNDEPVSWRIETVDEHGNLQDIYGWQAVAYGDEIEVARNSGESAEACGDRTARLSHNPHRGRVPVLVAIHHPANKGRSGGPQVAVVPFDSGNSFIN